MHDKFWLLDLDSAGGGFIVGAALIILGSIAIALYSFVRSQVRESGKPIPAVIGSIAAAFFIATALGTTTSSSSDAIDDPIRGSGESERVQIRTPKQANTLAWRIFTIIAGVGILGAYSGSKDLPQ